MKYVLLIVSMMAATQSVRAEEPVAATPAETNAVQHAPKIACSEATHDFGTVESQEFVEHTYVLKNEGDLTLEISNVRPSCGCTVANISEKSVAPGAETKVTARLNLQGRQGQQHKSIVVESNDPNQPHLTLVLQGTVAVAVDIKPDRVIFGRITADTSATSTVEISTSGTNTFKITKLESSSPNYSATQETIEEGKSYRVLIAAKGPFNPGAANATIHIETDHPKRTQIDIPVSASVVGELIVAPQEIILPDRGDRPMTRYVIIRPGNAATFKIESVEAPDPSIKTQILPFGSSGYRIMLENIVATKELNGKVLKITTNMEKMKDITVPFRVLVREPRPVPPEAEEPPVETTEPEQPAAAPEQAPE